MNLSASIQIVMMFVAMGGPNKVAVEFVVSAPPGTDEVYLAGGSPELGLWRPNGVRMNRSNDGRFHITVEIAVGTDMEFKFTRGSWDAVEKSADGGEIQNRKLKAPRAGKYEYTVERWADSGTPIPTGPKKPPKHSLTGDIRFHDAFPSKFLKDERPLIVYLPPGYKSNADLHYPVLYMHDGQNLFDAATSFSGVEWQVDETAEKLIKTAKIPPIIIVGIYNTLDRMNEYTPTRDAKRGAGGKGDAYTNFVIQEVKPFIDKTYRTKRGRDDTAIAGSSLGGLISLNMAYKHPEVFSKCGVISPALMWDDRKLLKEIEGNAAPLKRVKIWLDIGTAEGDSLADFKDATKDTRRLRSALESAGLRPGKDFRYAEIEGGRHNEADWARRFGEVLVFLFGATD